MAQTATDPTSGYTEDLNSHKQLGATDSNLHYPKGFIAAFDNHAPYKGNDGEITYGNAFQHLRVTIATGDVLTINSSPVELIPAPGAGKLLFPIQSLVYLDYNSAAYVGGVTMSIDYDSGGSTFGTISNSVLAATNDYVEQTNLVLVKGAPTANTAVVIKGSADPTVGNSPLIVDIWYRIMDYN